ncbi:hemerythrin domain-containing protein [Cytophagaceae bacterium ABcell3]|nr:hemerythrin domain-containing protein [Cytophagaceae bacterium ABcell3]
MPLKRHIALQDYSREHHLGLLLGWKISQGIAKKVPSERMVNYCQIFYESCLLPHMKNEEHLILNKFPSEDQDVKKIIEDHKSLQKQFEGLGNLSQGVEEALVQLTDDLEKHIRFEERIFFTKIQDECTEEELYAMKPEVVSEQMPQPEDEFWK